MRTEEQMRRDMARHRLKQQRKNKGMKSIGFIMWLRKFGLLPQAAVLMPYNYGQPNCPVLNAGDGLIFIPQNDGFDYVAASCNMNDTRYMVAGKKKRWKVLERDAHGSLLLKRGRNRTMTTYLSWDDGNRVTVSGRLFLHSTLVFRVFYEKQSA